MHTPDQLATMDAQQLRALAGGLIETLARRDDELRRQAQRYEFAEGELRRKDRRIEQLTHEMAVLKRWKYAARSERLDSAQLELLQETIDADLAAMQIELDALREEDVPKPKESARPRRSPLPDHLPRTEIRHEPESTTCACGCEMKRIGEDIAEKLDYVPGVFTVERHVRGKWACAKCATLVQAPVPAAVIDKGIPTAGLLAQVLVAKYADHLPLYRQERVFGRAGLAIPGSTLGQWVGVCGVRLQPLADALKAVLLARPVLHGDETPVAMLKPGKGRTHRAYLWSWCTTKTDGIDAVVFDFADSRSGAHARRFLGDWRGSLVCDDYSGYKALFEGREGNGVIEAGCMAHARRKFHDLHASHASLIAAEALTLIAELYKVESEIEGADAETRRQVRHERGKPAADRLHRWLVLYRQKVPDGTATAKAIDYSLKRWAALTRYLDDPVLPIDNNRVENCIRPIAIGRSNWLFAGSLRAGQRAAAVMSLIQSARINGHDPYAYLKDVLERLPTQPNSRIDELLPHRWAPATV